MKLTLTQGITAFTVSAGITILIAGCVISIVPMIVVGLSLVLAGGVCNFFGRMYK